MLFPSSYEFEGFHIGSFYENEIRKMLLDENYFVDYPVYLMTCKTNDPRENQLLAEQIVGNTFNLHANEYIVIFDMDDSKEFMIGFEHIRMHGDSTIRLCPLSQKSWKVWMDKTYEIMDGIKKKNKV